MSMAKEDLAKDNEKRSCELTADFTHLQLQAIHKIMTLKFALNEAFENSLSGTAHLPNFIGQLCRVTKATEIGKESIGLRISMRQFC
ncbi:unnamed protein product [Rotaria sp. Silwood1]|nr:unnamed protein product [Rotaria sp. Silwood1]CAF1638116.1 unnamed protein product [Rotaria sp. Silwood1]CAF3888940.1 unnamed protein product [Rotaria sp. Silwood1]